MGQRRGETKAKREISRMKMEEENEREETTEEVSVKFEPGDFLFHYIHLYEN